MSEGKSVLLTLALALASAVPASAHFAERQRSFSAYVESSDVVVRGVIEGVEQALVGEHAKQDGRATVHVEEALKGEPNAVADAPLIGPVQVRNPFALDSGAIDQEQFDWLKSELGAAESAGKLVLIFPHHPDLSFAEFGQFGFLVPGHVSAAALDGELASHPAVIAWIAGHTHRNRIRAFEVTDNTSGTNGQISAAVACPAGKTCAGFWEIETASLIDTPEEARIIRMPTP